MSHKLAFLFIAALSCVGTAMAADYVAENANKLTVGTGVRVRATPDTNAAEVGKLPLGTDLHTTQRTSDKTKVGKQSDYWYQIETPVKGWVFGGLVRDFNLAQSEQVWLDLALEKLGKSDTLYGYYEDKSPLSFSDAVEIGEFAQRAAKESKTPAIQGELELAYWRAMQIALWTGDSNAHEKPPYSTWRKTLGDNVLYSEPSAEYLIQPDVLWKLADKHKDDASGDVIAWQAANAYIGGECEGFVGCYSGRTLMMQGGYLKRYPQGKYLKPVLAVVKDTFDSIRKDWQADDTVDDLNLKDWASILEPLADSPEANKARAAFKKLQALPKK